MSTDEESVASNQKPATPTDGGKTVEREKERDRPRGKANADLLRHQQSFEARYSGMIQKQIWETTINKDVMERQLNAYFPFARSASLTKDGSDGFHQLLLPSTPIPSGSLQKTRSLGTTPTKQRSTTTPLDKCDTLDIAEQQPIQTKTTP